MTVKNRKEAGDRLCPLLTEYRKKDVILYALPRGGVVVAAPIASFLPAPLELLITRKIGHPLQPEYAIAAVSESGFLVANTSERIDPLFLERERQVQIEEIRRRKTLYLAGRPSLDPKGKTVIIVDDGIATGLTIQAGILELKAKAPQRIVVAVPIAPLETALQLRQLVDQFIALDTPTRFRGAIGAYYEAFPQVTDQEVLFLLKQHQT